MTLLDIAIIELFICYEENHIEKDFTILYLCGFDDESWSI